MSARMATILLKELRIKIRRVVLFTDSTTNLRWFNSGSCRFTPYVANRVGEVSFDATHWHYVPKLQNPADDLSRGVPASELTAGHRFFTGILVGSADYVARLSRFTGPTWLRPESRSKGGAACIHRHHQSIRM